MRDDIMSLWIGSGQTKASARKCNDGRRSNQSVGKEIPQQDDFRLPGPSSDKGADDGAQIRDRRVPADLRADSLSTVPPTPVVRM
ncbi:hypothetical protein PoB_005292600 [Plakobranchus ocellatus]|uniref:Uncharacterized protein n=1 Tax=Plakobranchus ocellatus TaxID=259542 RepID=A0AAV4C0Z1_9GAST|nr:hypothetical protein PoB_005292600 [Plakobranchus ocellatus]